MCCELSSQYRGIHRVVVCVQRQNQMNQLGVKQQQQQQQVQTSSSLVSSIISQQSVSGVQQQTHQEVSGQTAATLHNLQATQHQQQGLILLNKTSGAAAVVGGPSGDSVSYSPQMLHQFRLQPHLLQHSQLQQNTAVGSVQIRGSLQNSTTTQYSLAAQPQGLQQQQMIIVRHQQQQPPMIVVTAASQAQQQPMLLQPSGLRLATTALNRNMTPSVGVMQSARAQNAAGPFLTASRQQHPLNVTLSGNEQTLLLTQNQQQQSGGSNMRMPSFGLNLDLAGLSAAGQLAKTDGDVTPLTPQDQLSRYVDQL